MFFFLLFSSVAQFLFKLTIDLYFSAPVGGLWSGKEIASSLMKGQVLGKQLVDVKVYN